MRVWRIGERDRAIRELVSFNHEAITDERIQKRSKQVQQQIAERVAMTMTGHKTPSVFQRYNIVSGGDLKDAAHKLNVAGGRSLVLNPYP